MKKSIGMGLIAFFGSLLGSFAQSPCSSCIGVTDATLCYTDASYPRLCAAFNEQDAYFTLVRGKKALQVPYGAANEAFLLTLAQNKRLRLNALEILFIQRSLDYFKLESRKVGYTYRESGLGIKVVTQGDGETPPQGSSVEVHYTLYLLNGVKVDSSYDRDASFRFDLGRGQVIKGWDEGIAALSVGTTAWLYVPANIGYGERGRTPIPPNSDLVFQVELLSFTPQESSPQQSGE